MRLGRGFMFATTIPLLLRLVRLLKLRKLMLCPHPLRLCLTSTWYVSQTWEPGAACAPGLDTSAPSSAQNRAPSTTLLTEPGVVAMGWIFLTRSANHAGNRDGVLPWYCSRASW